MERISEEAPGGRRSWLFRRFVLCVALPVTLNVFVYYGFTTNYTTGTFTRQAFLDQYSHGIYRYRVVGRAAVLLTYDLIHRHFPSHGAYRLTTFLSTDSLDMYNSLFVVNTLFFCLTAWMFYATLSLPAFRLSERDRAQWSLTTMLLIAISEFVVVPYDLLSYFLLVFGANRMLREQSRLNTVVLACAVALATFTRETVLVTLALYATLWALRKETDVRLSTAGLFQLVGTFVFSLCALRAAYGVHDVMHGHSIFRASGWPGPSSLERGLFGGAGLAFFASLLYILMPGAGPSGARAARLLLLYSLPYTLLVLLFGVQFEIRLWIPIIIGVILCMLLDFRSTASGADRDADAAAAGGNPGGRVAQHFRRLFRSEPAIANCIPTAERGSGRPGMPACAILEGVGNGGAAARAFRST